MEIRTYDPGDWPALRAFINEHWRAGHPYTDRILFEWQFMGFACERPISKVVVDDGGQIAGFLGGTPGLYWTNRRVLPGVVFDLWVVRADVRDAGLGLLMMMAMEDEFDVCCCLGINQKALKNYTARGYGCSPSLHRWIVPLRAGPFRKIAAAAPGRSDAGEIAVPDLEDIPDAQTWRNPDTLALQIVYERTVEESFRFALHRNAEFWAWRYLRSAGFKYQIFGSVVDLGIVVARIESIVSPDHPDLDGLKVLRIIELLPTQAETWQGRADEAHLSLIRSVMAWAERKGCILADFQHSSDRLAHVLTAAGFTEADPAAPAAIQAVPSLFQPLRFDMQPINYVWRLTGPAAPAAAVEPPDIYFVKSDDGMDRPNLWPLVPGHV